MKQELKDKFPKWCQEDNIVKINNMCLSDDLDSLFSCIILQKLFPNTRINGFYDFKTLYNTKELNKFDGDIFGVDMDLTSGKCWGNHVTLHNSKSANINTVLGINQDNYYTKFCGSTLLTVLSYYNCQLDTLTEEAKMILLTIDSTFLSYWFNNGYYCKKYLELMEMEELLEVLSRHSKSEFEALNSKYNLKSKIYIDQEGQLQTNIKLEELGELFNLSFLLPKNKFNPYYELQIVQSPYIKHSKEEIFSCARTYKNALRYSIL